MQRDKISPEPLMKMVTGFWVTKVLTIAVQFDVFSSIESGITTVNKLKERLGINERPLKAILNANTALGLLQKNGEEYSNTPLSKQFLVKGKPSYFGDMILMQGTRLYDVWGKLEETVKKNKPQSDVSGILEVNEGVANDFTNAMHNNALGPANVLARKIDFSEFRTLLDIGGGSSAYSLTLAKNYPNLKAIVYDFAPVSKVANSFIKKYQLEDQVRTEQGNFLTDSFPKGFDVALISQILHSYGKSECKDLLKKTFKCLPSRGFLIINEFFLNDQESGPVFPALFAVNMLLESPNGFSYSKKEVSLWLEEIGYVEIKRDELTGPHSILTARKP